jgi:DNA-binding MarR family transcriptional regulator
VKDDQHILTGETIRRMLYRRDVAVARHRATLARTLGLTDIEMQALVHLYERGALTPAEIGSLLRLSSGGATALVQRLERSGQVTRGPHPTDGRSILVRLSQRTAERLDAAQTPVTSGMDAVTRPLTQAERITVTDVLTQLAVLTESVEAALRRDADAPRNALARPVPSLWG